MVKKILLMGVMFISMSAFGGSESIELNVVDMDFFSSSPQKYYDLSVGRANVSFKSLLKRAKSGDVVAQLHLGDVLYKGDDVDRDETEALK